MSDLIRILDDLIATCHDSKEGFAKAAKGVRDNNLRTRFVGIARQRADFADELAAHVIQLQGRPVESGHQKGIQHSGWRELDESIRPKDDSTFLANCEAGEENTFRHYEHAVTQDLPAPVRPIVERQKLAVQTALLELQNFEVMRRAG